MSVMCVARELSALGDETIRELERISGFRTIGKEFIETRMLEFGIKPEVRNRYDEKKPGFWASLSQDRDDYIHYLRSALYEEAQKGDCIIAGRGGFAIFAGVPGVVSVKLVAPYQVRIRRTREQFKCDEKRAEQLVKQSDHDRKGFHSYFFSADWNDASNFDLTLNTGREDPATVAALVDKLRAVLITPERAKACSARLGELVLGQKIVTSIVYGKGLPVHFLEAEVSGDRVTLHGVSNSQNVGEAAALIASGVQGVGKVTNDIQVVQEFTAMP